MTSCRGEGYNPPRRMIYYKRRMIYYNELRRRTWQSVREEEDNNIIQAEEEGTTIGNRRVRQYAEDDRGRHRTASLRQQLQHGAMRVLPWQRAGGINHYAEDWPRVQKYVWILLCCIILMRGASAGRSHHLWKGRYYIYTLEIGAAVAAS